MFNASDFKYKEVISLSDGEKLGYVYDMEIDIEKGCITKIIVPGKGKSSLFGKNPGTKIPWEAIHKIGDDIILVNMESRSNQH